MATCKTKRWGNSLAVIIPKEVREGEGIREGEMVDISITPIKINPLIGLWKRGGARKISWSEVKDMRKQLDTKWD